MKPLWKLSVCLLFAASIPVGSVRAQTPETDFLGAGQALYQRGNFAGAADLWQRATTQGDRPLQARAQANLAQAYEQLGRPKAADTAIATGLALLADLPEGDRATVAAQLLSARGNLEFLRGQPTEALATWQQAEAAYSEASDVVGMARSQINQVQALQSQGRLRQASRVLQRAIAQLPADRLQLKASALYQDGSLAARLGERERAQEALAASLAAAETAGDIEISSAALLGLGNLARARRDPEAIALYQQAAASSVVPARQLEALVNAFGAAVELDNGSVARALQREIDASLAIAPPSQAALFARLHLARVQIEALEQPEAPATPLAIAELLQETQRQARALGDLATASRALGTLGNLYERNGQPAEAMLPTQQALELAETVRAPEIAYRWQWQLGRLLAQRGDLPEAIAAYGEAVGLLQELRGDLVAIDAEARFSFRSEVEPVYREYVSLLLSAAPDSGQEQAYLALARETIEALQVAELVNFFRIDCEVGQIAQIERLDPQAAIVYPILLADRVEIILSVPGQPLASYSSPVERQVLLRELRRWQASLQNPFSSNYLQRSQKFYDWLLRPLADDLARQDIQTLAFVLDGPLRNVPMSALHDGDRYLIEDYAVAVAPGLQLLEPEPLERTSLQAILAGLTESRQGFIPLPGVGRELEKIQTLLPRSKVLLDLAFDETQFERALQESSAPIVHLATHGQFGSSPEETFLLTWNDRIDLSELSALLQQREQAIELLILSACETARGDDRAALGLAGVAVRAGARSTLASLWQVSDDSTAALMQEFYENLKEVSMTKSEALRQAQIAQLRDAENAHPFFWSPFVLIGNWL